MPTDRSKIIFPSYKILYTISILETAKLNKVIISCIRAFCQTHYDHSTWWQCEMPYHQVPRRPFFRHSPLSNSARPCVVQIFVFFTPDLGGRSMQLTSFPSFSAKFKNTCSYTFTFLHVCIAQWLIKSTGTHFSMFLMNIVAQSVEFVKFRISRAWKLTPLDPSIHHVVKTVGSNSGKKECHFKTLWH
jgi:hypothetical protein